MKSNKVFCSGCVAMAVSHQRVSPVLQMVLKVRFRRRNAVDMMVLVGYYDAVLVSGDGDQPMLLMQLVIREFGLKFSLRSMTSDSLFNVADRYIDLDLIKEDIQKTPRSVDASVNTSGIGYREERYKQASVFS